MCLRTYGSLRKSPYRPCLLGFVMRYRKLVRFELPCHDKPTIIPISIHPKYISFFFSYLGEIFQEFFFVIKELRKWSEWLSIFKVSEIESPTEKKKYQLIDILLAIFLYYLLFMVSLSLILRIQTTMTH